MTGPEQACEDGNAAITRGLSVVRIMPAPTSRRHSGDRNPGLLVN